MTRAYHRAAILQAARVALTLALLALIAGCRDEDQSRSYTQVVAYVVENRTTAVVVVEAARLVPADTEVVSLDPGSSGVLYDVPFIEARPFPDQVLGCISVRDTNGVLIYQDQLDDWTATWEFRFLGATEPQYAYILALDPDDLVASGVPDLCSGGTGAYTTAR